MDWNRVTSIMQNVCLLEIPGQGYGAQRAGVPHIGFRLFAMFFPRNRAILPVNFPWNLMDSNGASRLLLEDGE